MSLSLTVQNYEIELAARCALFLLRRYQRQIQQQDEMQAVLKSLKIHLRHHFGQSKRVVGMNLAALELVGKQLAEAGKQDFGGFAQSDFF